ncbi:hypothetical protein H0H92_013680 [Tricholoma furcatifolium]|nr:hypothetical protein H0H92_013680 [Tricholoma furcatifolium]
MNPFIDLKVEEPIALSTVASRAKTLKYIEKQIRVHASIITYYKRRHNAYTITCRIPTEILAIIFGQVVSDAHPEEAYSGLGKRLQRRPSFFWIGRISHVCSHWREVALSTPDLWSTIQVNYRAAWALDMLIQRSKNIDLSVIMWDSVSEEDLEKLVGSHLHRIKNLNADPVGEFQKITRLLGRRHDASTYSKMERLEMCSHAFAMENEFPDSIINALAPSAPLKHLALAGYGINWKLVHLFKSLETFHISYIPAQHRPSPVQVIRFLSQMPTLKHVSVAKIGPLQEVSPQDDHDARNSRIELNPLNTSKSHVKAHPSSYPSSTA